MVKSAGTENRESVTKKVGALALLLSKSLGRANRMKANRQKAVSWRVCAKNANESARSAQCLTVLRSNAHLKINSERAERKM